MNLPTLTVLINGTDVTAYVLLVNGYSLSRGRADWQGAVTAGELSLTLNNSDGRFTPGSAGGGFDTLPFGFGTFGGGASSVAVDASIVLKETVNGVTYTRFTGYVKSWPVSWPATVSTFSTVNVTATDAQARAERRVLRSALDEAILTASPSSCYALSEATGSSAAGDTSGNQAAPLVPRGTGPAPTFGTAAGPTTDDLTAAQFFGGRFLQLSGSAVNVASTPPTSIGAWFTSTTPGPSGSFSVIAYSNGYGLAIDAVGLLRIVRPGSSDVDPWTGPTVTDGQPHVAVLIGGPITATIILDGATFSTASSTGGSRTQTSVGGTSDPFFGGSFTGTISHFAVWPSLTTLAASAVCAAGLGSAESGTIRLSRLAGYASIPVGTLDPSLTNLAAAKGWSGSSVGAEIQNTADTELGLVYIDGAGALTFHNRNRVVSKTVPDLTLDHQWVTPDVQPTVDDQQIVNYFEATSSTGGVQVVRNAASETAHGRYPTSQSYLVRTDQEALDRANWIVAQFAEPTVRYGTLTINLAGMTPSMASTVVNTIDLDCWLRLTSMGSQTPGGTTVDVIVEGFQETVSADTWTLACNVVSRSLYAPVWRLDTSSLGTDTRLYV